MSEQTSSFGCVQTNHFLISQRRTVTGHLLSFTGKRALEGSERDGGKTNKKPKHESVKVNDEHHEPQTAGKK